MNILGFHFHSHRDIVKIEEYKYYGEMLKRDAYTPYRICAECKNIQEYSYDSQGGFWMDVPKNEQLVLIKYIFNTNGRYILNDEKDS